MCAKGRRWLGALSYSNATETKMGIIHAMLCEQQSIQVECVLRSARFPPK